MTRARIRQETIVLFTVGENRFAIAANAIREVREVEASDAIAASASRASQAQHRRRTDPSVLDAGEHFGIRSGKRQRVLQLREPAIAVLVSSVDRMHQLTRLYSLPRALSGRERRWYRGLALLHDGVVPVVNPKSFVPASAPKKSAHSQQEIA